MVLDWIEGRKARRAGFYVSAAAILIVFASGCGSTGKTQQQIADQMLRGDYPSALTVVEDERTGAFGGKNRLLYFLERGMLLHVDGQWVESNLAFEEAKRIGDELYTRSLSNEGFSLMSNDYALDYAGENFERTMIHLFAALNYVQLREPDSALVEVRQVGDYLRQLQVDSTNENVYQEDAFARYLSALLYESSGELDSAFVDYKKATTAYHAYETKFAVAAPTLLMSNAGRVASQLGNWAQEDLRVLGVAASPRVLPEGAGEIILLHYNGLLPIKSQDKYTIPFSDAWVLATAFQAAARTGERTDVNRAIALSSQIRGVDVVSVAFPKFVDRPYVISHMRPQSDAALEISSAELVEDIGAIAVKDLADRIARIRTKTIARAAIKYSLQKGAEIAAQQAGGEYGDLLGAVTQISGNIARFASEQADKRVWSTLPDEIWMSSLVLPAGVHDLKVDFVTANEAVVESRMFSAVEVLAGRRQYIIVRTVR